MYLVRKTFSSMTKNSDTIILPHSEYLVYILINKNYLQFNTRMFSYKRQNLANVYKYIIISSF